jgi:hypothetical protein
LYTFDLANSAETSTHCPCGPIFQIVVEAQLLSPPRATVSTGCEYYYDCCEFARLYPSI